MVRQASCVTEGMVFVCLVFGPFLVTCNLWYLLLWAPFGGHQPVSVFPLMMLFDYCVKRTVACLVLKDLRGVSVLSCGLQCMCVCVWWVSLVPCRYPVSHQSLICWLYSPGSCWEVCCVKLVRLKVLSPIFPLILHCLFHPPGGGAEILTLSSLEFSVCILKLVKDA